MGGKSPRGKFGVDIEAVDNEGKTALHRAAMFSDTDKVQQVHNNLLENYYLRPCNFGLEMETHNI